MSSTPRRLLVNTLANLFNMVVRVGMSFIVAPLLISGLGAEGYSIWILVTTFSLGSLFSLMDLGLQQATVKFVAERRDLARRADLNSVYSLSLFLYTGLGFIAASFVLMLVVLGPQRLLAIDSSQISLVRYLLSLVSVGLVFEFIGMAFTGLVRGINRLDIVRYIETAASVGWLVAIVVVVGLNYGITALVIVNLFFLLARIVILVVAAYLLIPGLKLTRKIEKGLWSQYSRFVRSVALMKLSSFVWFSVDKILISTMLSASLLADYDVAYKLHQLVFYSMYMVSAAVMPVAASLHVQGKDSSQRALLMDATKYTLALTLPVASFSLLLADPFIALWVGPEWAHLVPLARLYLLHFFVSSLVPVGSEILQGMGKLRPVVRAALVAAVANLLISMALAAKYGLYGLAFGTTAASVLSSVLLLPAVLRELGLAWREFFRQTVGAIFPAIGLSSLALFLTLQWRKPGSLFEVAVFAFVALMLFFAIFWRWSLKKSEREALLERFFIA